MAKTSAIKKADETLMRLMTANWRYRRLEDRPQTRIAVVSTIVAVWTTAYAILSGYTVLRILCIFFVMSAFYEWRLWYRLKVRNKASVGGLYND
jgi:FlaA1/EpsC-like NDP-sugar epimerase